MLTENVSRLTIVQYAGDYREAYLRLSRGGQETYHAQRYSLNLVGSLAQQRQVAVICALTAEKYDVVLENGVRAVGSGLRSGFHPSELLPDLINTAPTHLSLTTPMVPLLKWANANRVRTIAPLADSFQKGGLRQTFRHRRLAYHLNRPNVEWVGNHGINACLSLMDIGVRSEKIVPWDWPPSHRPSQHAARSMAGDPVRRLLYVGSVIPEKGVGDLIEAMARLRHLGTAVRLFVVGWDPDGSMAELSKSLGTEGIVEFAGMIPNEEIPAMMRRADAVIIPSRHEYPEGLPLTIYEALSARTPIIASDHPMFRGALVDGESALIFKAGSSGDLALAILGLFHDTTLYERLSVNSDAAWKRLQLPVTMGGFLQAWLSDNSESVQWIRSHALNSGLYDELVDERRSALKKRP